MGFNIEVKIPVSGYILKFLQKKYGDTHRLSKRSHLGCLLIKSIKKPLNNKYFFPADGAYTFTVLVPESYQLKYGFDLDGDTVAFLNQLLETLFSEAMIDYVNLQLETGRTRFARTAVAEFLDYYGISEDERSLNTAYQSYKRSTGFKIKSKKALKAL